MPRSKAVEDLRYIISLNKLLNTEISILERTTLELFPNYAKVKLRVCNKDYLHHCLFVFL